MNIYPGQIINYSQMAQNIYTTGSAFGGLGNLLGGISGSYFQPIGLTNVPHQSIVYQLPYQPPVHNEPEIVAKPKSASHTALELIEKLSRQEKFVAGEKMICEEKTLAAVDLCHF
jgi:hypothetical protein